MEKVQQCYLLTGWNIYTFLPKQQVVDSVQANVTGALLAKDIWLDICSSSVGHGPLFAREVTMRQD